MQLCLETNEKMTLQDLFILLRVTVLTWQLKCYGHGLVSTAKPELQQKVWMLAKIKFKKTQNFWYWSCCRWMRKNKAQVIPLELQLKHLCQQ